MFVRGRAFVLANKRGSKRVRTLSWLALSLLITGASQSLPASANPAYLCRNETATIVGTSENEEITGTSGDDIISGRGGHDTISGLEGDDLICGGSGNDRIAGGAGYDDLWGSAGNDLVKGGGQDDEMGGGLGDDHLRGGQGLTFFDADAGNDRIIGDPDYSNRIDFGGHPVGVRVDLGNEIAIGEGTDVLKGIAIVDGSPHRDVIVGDAQANSLEGNGGKDQIFGRGGHDDLVGWESHGGPGDDRLVVAAHMYGGSGFDTAHAFNLDIAFTMNLNKETWSVAGGGGTVENVEAVQGSLMDDVLIGDAERNVLSGFGGDDVIKGRGGDDELGLTYLIYNEHGSDVIRGGLGDDSIVGGDDDDTLGGGQGDDVIEGDGFKEEQFVGDDTLYGGLGFDFLDGGPATDSCFEGETLLSCETTDGP